MINNNNNIINKYYNKKRIILLIIINLKRTCKIHLIITKMIRKKCKVVKLMILFNRLVIKINKNRYIILIIMGQHLCII